MGRSPCCSKDQDLNRGAWTAMEDKILTDYIKLHGEGKWRNLPKMAGLKRCGKSCRLRWLNYLRPDIKRGNITQDEEDLIIRLHKLLGNRWSLIAGRIPGRTDNEIKNYWNTTIGKKLRNQPTSSSNGKASNQKTLEKLNKETTKAEILEEPKKLDIVDNKSMGPDDESLTSPFVSGKINPNDFMMDFNQMDEYFLSGFLNSDFSQPSDQNTSQVSDIQNFLFLEERQHHDPDGFQSMASLLESGTDWFQY